MQKKNLFLMSSIFVASIALISCGPKTDKTPAPAKAEEQKVETPASAPASPEAAAPISQTAAPEAANVTPSGTSSSSGATEPVAEENK